MSRWPAAKAKRVFTALGRIGWTIKVYKSGSHRTLQRAGWRDYTWAFHDDEELGPKILSRISKLTGLSPADL